MDKPFVVRNVILQFFKTGELGPVNCSLSREEVRRLFGDPCQWDGREACSYYWQYEALTVYFDEAHRVVGYGLGFWPDRPIPSALNTLAGDRYLELTMHEVRVLLISSSIPFEETADRSALRTGSDVMVNKGLEGRVMSIIYPSLKWASNCWRAGNAK